MFVDGTNFDVEELVIDLYYWFDKSTKRKNELQSFCILATSRLLNILQQDG